MVITRALTTSSDGLEILGVVFVTVLPLDNFVLSVPNWCWKLARSLKPVQSFSNIQRFLAAEATYFLL